MGSFARRFVLAVPMAVVGACALPSADEFAHPADGGPTSFVTLDAGVVNDGSAAVDADASGGLDVDAGPPVTNLLAGNTSDFEAGNCAGSGGYNSTETGDPTAHSGNYACRICRMGSGGTAFTIDTNFLQHPAIGVTLHASAWVRTAPSASVPGPVTIYVRTSTSDVVGIQSAGSSGITLTDDWQFIDAALEVTKASDFADVYVSANASDSACFLVDDLIAWQEGA